MADERSEELCAAKSQEPERRTPCHAWSGGYGGINDTKTREGLEKTYLGLMDKLGELAEKGLGGSVYTQTTDVEIEINGILTYDRKVLKFDPAVLKSAHQSVIDRFMKSATAK